MELLANENQTACPSPEISAYIDGELTPHDELQLEMHIADCHLCREDLNLQKTFLNALDMSIEAAQSIELPLDFTKSVVANAESNVAGLRRPFERRNAAIICFTLVALALLALGSNAENAFIAGGAVAGKVVAVVVASGHFIYDIALGTTVVSRSLASSLVFGSSTAISLFLFVLVLSLFVFSRLLVRFHRS